MKKIFVKVLVFVLFVGFVACNDDPDPEGIGDVYVISNLSPAAGEGEEPTVVYGLHMDAYPYNGTFSSVKATLGVTNFTLEKDNDTGMFVYEQDEYSPEPPADGTYTFTYTFSDGVITSSADALTDDVLIPATITTCDFADNKIELEWDEIEDAEAIYIQLKEADGDIVFNSKTSTSLYLSGEETEYTIQESSGTWLSGYSPTDGATYTVEIVALLGGSVGLQAISVSTDTVVWGAGE